MWNEYRQLCLRMWAIFTFDFCASLGLRVVLIELLVFSEAEWASLAHFVGTTGKANCNCCDEYCHSAFDRLLHFKKCWEVSSVLVIICSSWEGRPRLSGYFESMVISLPTFSHV